MYVTLNKSTLTFASRCTCITERGFKCNTTNTFSMKLIEHTDKGTQKGKIDVTWYDACMYNL